MGIIMGLFLDFLLYSKYMLAIKFIIYLVMYCNKKDTCIVSGEFLGLVFHAF